MFNVWSIDLYFPAFVPWTDFITQHKLVAGTELKFDVIFII